MDPQAAFGFQQLFSFVIGDMAKAVSDRAGETQDQRFARSQAAAHMILGFLPRDVIEAMLAGHCVMLHEIMTATVADALRGDVDKIPRAGGNVVRLAKAFNDNLDRLERYQQRPADGTRDGPETLPPEAHDDLGSPPMPPMPAMPTETNVSQPPEPALHGPNRAARRLAARAANRAAALSPRAAAKPEGGVPRPEVQPSSARSADTRRNPASPGAGTFYTPSPEAIAACEANPVAMTALRSGDAAGFARALGIAHPGDAFLAAANTPGSPFDPQTSGPWPDAAVVTSP